MDLALFWFRRDLRLEDNTALRFALESGYKVLPIFIFDENILDELPEDDARISFIYDSLQKIDHQLREHNCSLKILKGSPTRLIKELLSQYEIRAVFFNHDYEPYARDRDHEIGEMLKAQGIGMQTFKDQVIFEKDEVVKEDKRPYTVYTPYKNKWLRQFETSRPGLKPGLNFSNFLDHNEVFPKLEQLNFTRSDIEVKPYDLENLSKYSLLRDLPAEDATSYLGPHLRFGTVSIRSIIRQLKHQDETFLSELIWREFFMQILYHFPSVVDQSFRSKYDQISWRNNEEEFQKWYKGKTGYPFVDAGMRQLNQTGFMHNRVRMATASFLVKHLLVDWRWGEAYFAEKLLDYELSSNKGNWQWAAGTGCDAAPYFRVFNPITQRLKFDKQMNYVKRWIPELETPEYPKPIIEHAEARKRALQTYRSAVK